METQGLSDREIVGNVHERADFLEATRGPSDVDIVRGVRSFADRMQYWYVRVMEEAVPNFDKLLVGRINPIVRGMQLEGLNCRQVARQVVADYAQRNFVTAGGWALEALAIDASPRLRKSSTRGIDGEWTRGHEPLQVDLYVLKSGPVTRNSDILSSLKDHGRRAEQLLKQTDRRVVVTLHYAVLTGQRSSSFHDGVNRPSSAEFWAEAFAMDDQSAAVELALAMAQTGGHLLATLHDARSLEAIEVAVAAYVATPDAPDTVDWEFLARHNMIGGSGRKAEAAVRHQRAVVAVEGLGYVWPHRRSKGRTLRWREDAAGGAAEDAEMLPIE